MVKRATPETATNGPDAEFGDAVQAETQTTESDGARTLANPVRDPGPFIREGGVGAVHPDKLKDQKTIGSANEPFKVVQRTASFYDAGGRPDNMTSIVDMAPDLALHGGASDIYNKEKGEGLTDMAAKKAAEGHEPAPLDE